MKIGFSFSPGGLLFPYHLGVLSTLSRRGYVTDNTPLVGSSAGAIAVASQGAGVSPEVALDGCIRISRQCIEQGGARGRLLPLLQAEMDVVLPGNAHQVVNNRGGMVGLAYKEIFPIPRSVLATQFDTREDLIEDVCNSSMFPFFTTNWPCRWVAPRGGKKGGATSAGARIPLLPPRSPVSPLGEETLGKILYDGEENKGMWTMPTATTSASESATKNNDFIYEKEMSTNGIALEGIGSINLPTTGVSGIQLTPRLASLPRLVVDGYFTVPRERFGCPIFPEMADVDRTVTVSVFPTDFVGLNSVTEECDRIGPDLSDCTSPEEMMAVMTNLLREATEASTAEQHYDMFDRGIADAERWCVGEEERKRITDREAMLQPRKFEDKEMSRRK